MSLIAFYFIAYSSTVFRDDGRWRNAGEYGFIRYYNCNWQVYLFAPAAYCESWAIRFYPEKFLTNTSWIGTPMVLLIKGPNVQFPFKASERLCPTNHRSES
jgi:hypothetical protein